MGWLTALWSTVSTAARAAKATAHGVRKAATTTARWAKTAAAKTVHLTHKVRSGLRAFGDWQVDMLTPHIHRARWHAKSAQRGVARADAALFKGDLHMADFELKHAAMEQANAAKLLSGKYPQLKLETGIPARTWDAPGLVDFIMRPVPAPQPPRSL